MIKTRVMRKVYTCYNGEGEISTFWNRPDEESRLKSLLYRNGISTHVIVGKKKLIIHIEIQKL